LILFISTSQVIGWEDWVFAPIKRLAGKVGSEMTYNVQSRSVNPTLSVYIINVC